MPAYPLTQTNNFSPSFGKGQSISATTSSSSVTLTEPGITGCSALHVYNSGTGAVFVRWGVGAQTATTADMPIPPGGTRIFNKDVADTVAAITASGTATVYVMPGQGS